MKKIGNARQITKYVPLWFEDIKEESKANDFKDSTGKSIQFKSFKKCKVFIDGFTSKRTAIAKSVETITIYM